MHQRTYNRLKARHDTLAAVAWAGIAQRLGLINRRLAAVGFDLDDLGRDG